MVYMTNCPTCGYNGVDGDKCPYCGNEEVTDSVPANANPNRYYPRVQIKKCKSCEKEFDYHMMQGDKGWACKECFEIQCKKCKDIKTWKGLEEKELDYFSENSMCKKCNNSQCFYCEEVFSISGKNYKEAIFETHSGNLEAKICNECYEESLNQDD